MIARSALLGLLFSPLLAASDAKPVPLGAVPEPAMQFHPIRVSASKRNDGGGKPWLPEADHMPITVALRLHTHSDGSVRFDCDEDHSALADERSASEKSDATR